MFFKTVFCSQLVINHNTCLVVCHVEISNKDLIVGVLKCYLLCIVVVNIRACLVCISCMSRVYLVHIHVYLVYIRSYSSHFVLRFKCIKVKVI